MIEIALYDEKEIDTSSNKLKRKVSNAIKKYVLNNWDAVTEFEQTQFVDRHELVIKLSL